MRPLADRVGIYQGRLVPSTNGQMQCHPGARWPEEFALAKELGLGHVELFAERAADPANPIWTESGRAEVRAVVAGTGVAALGLCVEEPLDQALVGVDRGARLGARLAPVAAELGLRVVVLALSEASDLAVVEWTPVADALRALEAHLATTGTRCALELSVDAAESRRFLDLVGVPAIGLCYDLGNATAAGLVPADEIRALGARITHLHAKDKDADGANVRFGTGRVDFPAAFAALAEIGYDGPVTMEATRGDDPVATAAAHRAFLLALERPAPDRDRATRA